MMRGISSQRLCVLSRGWGLRLPRSAHSGTIVCPDDMTMPSSTAPTIQAPLAIDSVPITVSGISANEHAARAASYGQAFPPAVYFRHASWPFSSTGLASDIFEGRFDTGASYY
jgi:hypothetical protein